MRFDILTLFPELFPAFLSAGVTRRAFEAPQGGTAQVETRLWPLRDHAEGNYRRVDDRPFGGGPGMVMLAQPLLRALDAVRADQQAAGRPATPVILFSPAGRSLTQERVRSLARSDGAVLICGRYEGIDQRVIDAKVDEEISLGDFVLSGGELPALALLDAIARLQPGVLNDAQSHEQDSFSDGLLDCPHYSRPESLAVHPALPEQPVPPVLLSGHHAEIARWRRQRQLELTARRRPDLLVTARARGDLTDADERFLAGLKL
ncbi:MAG: tRNA (guanosine(37)-N1)-methyltransferase TrmD [Aquabacterium sp.]|nr:MAG: tRNA (guanosine(37)-N1)-methyltransferase TrmD [Aquabacterium sp.]